MPSAVIRRQTTFNGRSFSNIFFCLGFPNECTGPLQRDGVSNLRGFFNELFPWRFRSIHSVSALVSATLSSRRLVLDFPANERSLIATLGSFLSVVLLLLAFFSFLPFLGRDRWERLIHGAPILSLALINIVFVVELSRFPPFSLLNHSLAQIYLVFVCFFLLPGFTGCRWKTLTEEIHLCT